MFVFMQVVQIFFLECSPQLVTPFCGQEEAYLEVNDIGPAVFANEDIAPFIEIHIADMALVDRLQEIA